MIIKFKIFEDSEYKKGNFDVLYRDNNMTIIVPKSLRASQISCRNTNWCSKTKNGYDMWSVDFTLYRILYKDGFKLRLTWLKTNLIKKNDNNQKKGSWGSGGDKYEEIEFYTEPFNNEELMNNNKDNYLYYKDKYPSEKWVEETFNDKKDMIERINSIPDEVKDKIINYDN